MTGPSPVDQGVLQPATGAPQPSDGWRGADLTPAELVSDAWLADQPDVQQVDLSAYRQPPGAGRYGATGSGWSRDTMRRVVARTGLPAVEAWSARNVGAMGTVVAPLLHHTGTPASAAGDYPTLRVVRDGRADLANSLCMFGLGRSGTVYLVSERLSWHAGAGSFGGITDGNGHLAGIEAESDGTSWTAAQVDAYPRLVASILLETGRGADWAPRHADYALPKGRKTDTAGLDVGALRATVARYLASPALISRTTTTTPEAHMRVVAAPNRPAALIGPASFQVLSAEEVGTESALWGRVDTSDRAYDVSRQRALNAAVQLDQVHDKMVRSRLGLAGRPGADTDDLLGHVLSTRAAVQKLAATPAATVEAGTLDLDDLAEQVAARVAADLATRLAQ